MATQGEQLADSWGEDLHLRDRAKQRVHLQMLTVLLAIKRSKQDSQNNADPLNSRWKCTEALIVQMLLTHLSN